MRLQPGTDYSCFQIDIYCMILILASDIIIIRVRRGVLQYTLRIHWNFFCAVFHDRLKISRPNLRKTIETFMKMFTNWVLCK